MRRRINPGFTAATLALLIIQLLSIPPISADVKSKATIGQQLALEHCQTCHAFEGTEQAGNVAPPLFNMKERFPKPSKLYDIIYDPALAIKPQTMMPPFGKHELLSKQEIKQLVDYLYTL